MLLKKALTAIFPYRCILCNLRSNQTKDLCQDCQLELPWIKNGCKLCGHEISIEVDDKICGNCLKQPPAYDNFLAPFEYTATVISIIKQLKFHGKLIFVYVLGDLLIEELCKRYQNLQLPQLLIPIPLHKKRLQKRGYNQALLLAKIISKRLNIPIDYSSTMRLKNTVPQSSLSAEKRSENIREAFVMVSPLSSSYVAIVDDVMTTGNTVREFSRLLKKNGVKRVDVWCLAKTPNK